MYIVSYKSRSSFIDSVSLDKRYTCVHASCLPEPGHISAYFPTWSALQHHMRSAHPPSCNHPKCNGKTFSTQKGLRAHQKLHEQREMDDRVQSEEEEGPPRKRRRGGELGRDWRCQVLDCGKDFKTVCEFTRFPSLLLMYALGKSPQNS